MVFMARQFMRLQPLRLCFSLHSICYKRCSILQCYHSDFPSAGSCGVILTCMCFKVKHCLYIRRYSILHSDMWTCGPRLGRLEYMYFFIVSAILFFLVLSSLFPPPVNSFVPKANLLHTENECIYTISCLSNVVLSL